MARPYVVGIGGTTRPGSSTEMALSACLKAVAEQDCDTLLFAGADLDFPAYAPHAGATSDSAHRFLQEIRRADGIIIGTPGYHGGISGLVKNALDYTEDLKQDRRPYLDERPVGCIVTAAGEQGAVTTLAALRSVVHALRGWPTPFGAAIVTAAPVFDSMTGQCLSSRLEEQLSMVARQVVDFARARRSAGPAEVRSLKSA